MGDYVIIPSPAEDYVSLSENSSTTKLFRKKILPMNKSFVHPADPTRKIFVDESMARTLIKNFKSGVCEVVPMPLVDEMNRHNESPLLNSGRVTGLDYDSNGVYVTLQPTEEYANDFGTKFLGASATLHLNYPDSATGERVGATLLNVSVTNRPHLTNLGDYKEIIKASADIDSEAVVMTQEEPSSAESQEEVPEVTPEATAEVEPEGLPTEEVPNENEEGQMTPDEMIAALKEHGIDVKALQADASRVAELSGQLDSAMEQLQLSAASNGVEVTDIAEAVVELSNTISTQENQIASLLESNRKFAETAAVNEVDSLIRTGRLLPKQRDVMVRLSMDDRETFEALVPETAVVSLSEQGVTVHEEPESLNARNEQISRYKDMAARMGNHNRS